MLSKKIITVLIGLALSTSCLQAVDPYENRMYVRRVLYPMHTITFDNPVPVGDLSTLIDNHAQRIIVDASRRAYGDKENSKNHPASATLALASYHQELPCETIDEEMRGENGRTLMTSYHRYGRSKWTINWELVAHSTGGYMLKEITVYPQIIRFR